MAFGKVAAVAVAIAAIYFYQQFAESDANAMPRMPNAYTMRVLVSGDSDFEPVRKSYYVKEDEQLLRIDSTPTVGDLSQGSTFLATGESEYDVSGDGICIAIENRKGESKFYHPLVPESSGPYVFRRKEKLKDRDLIHFDGSDGMKVVFDAFTRLPTMREYYVNGSFRREVVEVIQTDVPFSEDTFVPSTQWQCMALRYLPELPPQYSISLLEEHANGEIKGLKILTKCIVDDTNNRLRVTTAYLNPESKTVELDKYIMNGKKYYVNNDGMCMRLPESEEVACPYFYTSDLPFRGEEHRNGKAEVVFADDDLTLSFEKETGYPLGQMYNYKGRGKTSTHASIVTNFSTEVNDDDFSRIKAGQCLYDRDDSESSNQEASG